MGKIVLSGTTISEGVGVGRISTFEQIGIEINRGKIKEAHINEEVCRLEVAIDKTLYEICDLSDDLRKRLEKESNMIFEAYKSILVDKYFISEIKDLILTDKVYAENAVDICINNYIKAIEISDNDYVKQSIVDIKEIGSRIIRNIIGGKSVKHLLEDIDSKRIIIIKCLTPWLAAAFGKRSVAGVVTDAGAAFLSHSAIILRGLGIPLINKVSYEVASKYNDEVAIIDSKKGILIINPDKNELSSYKDICKNKFLDLSFFFKKKNSPADTIDKKRISITANIGNYEECEIACDNFADGVGLVRTEILFINSKVLPDEKGQYSQYAKIIKKLKPWPVIFRTIDAGEDKIFSGYTSKMSVEKSGLRGISFSLSNIEQLIIQLRAIIKAALLGDVGIMFPMVNSVEDILEVKELISSIISQMEEKDKIREKLKIGAVIESRKGIENINEILESVDFISIGTNDLLQEIQRVNRINSVSGNKLYLHPDFLIAIKYCSLMAMDKNKPISVCGEMAGDLSAAILLVGMGINGLSMHPLKIPIIKDLIRKVNFQECRSLADEALGKLDEYEVSILVSEWLKGVGQ